MGLMTDNKEMTVSRLKKQHDAEVAALEARLNAEHKAKSDYLEDGWRTSEAKNAHLAADLTQKLDDNAKLSKNIVTANNKLQTAKEHHQEWKKKYMGGPKPETMDFCVQVSTGESERLKSELQQAETRVEELSREIDQLKKELGGKKRKREEEPGEEPQVKQPIVEDLDSIIAYLSNEKDRPKPHRVKKQLQQLSTKFQQVQQRNAELEELYRVAKEDVIRPVARTLNEFMCNGGKYLTSKDKGKL